MTIDERAREAEITGRYPMSMSTEEVIAAAAAERRAWLQMRRKGIGGSDASAVLGVNPYRTALDVWADKRGLTPLEDGLDQTRGAVWWGRRLEPLVLDRYSVKTGRSVVRPPVGPAGLKFHADHAWMFATPDALVVDQRLGVEAKLSAYSDGWGDEGSDEIPHEHLVQVIHQMAVFDFPAWDVAALLGSPTREDVRVFRVHRDRAFEAEIIDRLDRWWRHHVVGGLRPDLDGTLSSRRFVHARFPRDVEPLKAAPAEAQGWAERLARARTAYGLAEAEKHLCETNLKDLIGEAEGFIGSGWKATWRLTRGRREVDWEAIARERYGNDVEHLAAAIGMHTQERDGFRRFLFTLNGGDE